MKIFSSPLRPAFCHYMVLGLCAVLLPALGRAQPGNTPNGEQQVQQLLLRANSAVASSPDSVGWYAKEAIRISLRYTYRPGIAGGLLYYGRAEAAKSVSAGDPFFRKSLMLYDSLGDAEGRAQCYNRLADTQLRKGRIDSCVYFGRLALQQGRNTNNHALLARVYRGLGAAFVQIAAYDSARVYLGLAMQVCEQHDVQTELAAAYDNYADLYYRPSQADAKADMLLKALRVNEALNSTLGMAYQYHKLGKVRASQRRFEEAQANYLKATDLFRSAANPAKVAEVQADYAEDLLIQANFSEAVSLARQAYKAAMQAGDIRSQIHSGCILVDAYAEMGRFDDALTYYEKCLEVADKSPNATYICRLQMGIARAYLAKNDLITARELFTQVLGVAQNVQDNYYIAESARMLYEVYHLLNQDDRATEYKLLYRETLRQGDR